MYKTKLRVHHPEDWLTHFQSLMFATVLEDAIAEVNILEESNNALRVTKAIADMGILLARKFAVPQRTVGNELDDIDPKKLNCMEYKLQKLENDRKYIKDVLVGTYTNLSLNRHCDYLKENVEETENNSKYRENLILEENNNRILRRDLNRQLRHLRNHVKSVYYDTNALIENLRTSVEDTDLNSHIRGRYINSWQRARYEQHKQTIDDKESKPLQSIMYYKQRTDQEHRVHAEVELLMNISINETLQEVETWMNKYDKDIEAIDLKIQKRKNQYEDMMTKRENLEKMIEEHAVLIKNWLKFKDEREKARLYHEKMTNAAIAVQAWWRGLLVRNQLGPYKVVKKKPPPPAPGGGKKKK